MKKKEILKPLEAFDRVVEGAIMSSLRYKKPGEDILSKSKEVRAALQKLKSKDVQNHRGVFGPEPRKKKREGRLTKAVKKQREEDKAKSKKVKK